MLNYMPATDTYEEDFTKHKSDAIVGSLVRLRVGKGEGVEAKVVDSKIVNGNIEVQLRISGHKSWHTYDEIQEIVSIKGGADRIKPTAFNLGAAQYYYDIKRNKYVIKRDQEIENASI